MTAADHADVQEDGTDAEWARAAAIRRTVILWILITFIGLGAGLRLRQYLARASFFSDEASLILNFRTHTAAELMRHLDYRQAAPPVFLWVGRAMYLHFGPSEYALRLLPLLGGIAALVLFGLLAWKVLPPAPAVFAVACFATCENLINFCGELKQYSTDVFAAVLLLAAFFLWSRTRTPARRLLQLALITSALIWLSHPSIIIFAALAIILLWASLRRGRWAFLAAAVACLPVAISFGVLYLVSIRHLHDPFLFQFWSGGFPDWSRPIAFPLWLLQQTYELVNTPYLGLGALFIVLTAVATIAAYRRKQPELLVAGLGPLALTAIAACAHQYPYNGSRLTLFLFPGLFLMVASGAAALRNGLPRPWCRFWWVATLPVLGMGLAQGGYHAIHPHYLSHIRPVVQYVRERLQPGEAIYLLGEPGPPRGPLLAPGFHNEFLAYWPDPPAVVHTHLESVQDIHERRFWIVLAYRPHVTRTVQLFDRVREVADSVGKPFIVKEGAAACLFELRTAQRTDASSPNSPVAGYLGALPVSPPPVLRGEG
ncbi:MAG TPA: glycosyltransferase family 39 protein [Tepidisphaeraceae bacterium]|nr:glycosyltransferase family 39 protein [Tepidisphaeraceae bacterium]